MTRGAPDPTSPAQPPSERPTGRRPSGLTVALRVGTFVAITLLLTWLWDDGGGRLAYGRFLKAVAPPIYDVLGFEGARVGAFRQRYVNFVPFVGLLLVTPGLTLRRRVLGLVIGLFVLFCGHLALNLTEIGRGRARHLPLVPSLISDTLPFVVWLFVAAPALARRLLPAADYSADAPRAASEPTSPGLVSEPVAAARSAPSSDGAAPETAIESPTTPTD